MITWEMVLGAAGAVISVLLSGYVFFFRWTFSEALKRLDKVEIAVIALDKAQALSDQAKGSLQFDTLEIKKDLKELSAKFDRFIQGRQSHHLE